MLTPSGDILSFRTDLFFRDESAWKAVFDWAGYDTLEKMCAAPTEDVFTLAARYAAGNPVFAYQFAHALPDDEAGSHDMKGAFHSSELWYMFKSLDRGDRPFTQADWALAEHVVSCWTNFAKTGDPGLGWKPYTQDAPDFMVFDLSEDGAKDVSAMGAPLPRRE